MTKIKKIGQKYGLLTYFLSVINLYILLSELPIAVTVILPEAVDWPEPT